MSSQHQKRQNGRFVPDCSDKELLNAIQANGPPADTSSIAEAAGLSRRQTYTRLNQLHDQDKVTCNQVGNSLCWDLNVDCSEVNRAAVEYLADELSGSPPDGFDALNGMVIAIRRPHSQAVLAGEKDVEFRRSTIRDSNSPDVGFVYEPAPTKAIVGIFSVKAVETCSIKWLKELATEQPTSTPESIEQYFDGKSEGTAIFIDHTNRITPPVSLHGDGDSEWMYSPPQNFYYVDPQEFLADLQNQYSDNPPGDSQESGSLSRTE